MAQPEFHKLSFLFGVSVFECIIGVLLLFGLIFRSSVVSANPEELEPEPGGRIAMTVLGGLLYIVAGALGIASVKRARRDDGARELFIAAAVFNWIIFFYALLSFILIVVVFVWVMQQGSTGLLVVMLLVFLAMTATVGILSGMAGRVALVNCHILNSPGGRVVDVERSVLLGVTGYPPPYSPENTFTKNETNVA